jgi:hypothetical protein
VTKAITTTAITTVAATSSLVRRKRPLFFTGNALDEAADFSVVSLSIVMVATKSLVTTSV